MDTANKTSAASGCATDTCPGDVPAVSILIPDYSKMGMYELRLYFQTLRMLADAFNGQQSRAARKPHGVGSEISGWLDDAFAAVDTMTVDLMQYLQNVRLEGSDERFRLCMLIEYDAWLGESLEDIARTIRTALVPIPDTSRAAA